MYTVFRVHLLIAHLLLYRHLAVAKSSSYLSSIALYCRQKLWRNVALTGLKEIT
jgi:hypothetical protein